MGRLVYWFPGAPGVSGGFLRGLGLGHVWEDGVANTSRVYTLGGTAGRLWAMGGDPVVGGLEDVEWAAVEEFTGDARHAGVMLGVMGSVRAADLARASMVPGRVVRTLTGDEWSVPMAVAFADGRLDEVLPGRLRWVRGAATRVRDAGMEKLTAAALGWWRELADSGRIGIELDVVVEALGLNYRVGVAEVSMLGALDDRDLVPMAQAIMDWEGCRAVEKKSLVG
jgi:hypothetical protein